MPHTGSSRIFVITSILIALAAIALTVEHGSDLGLFAARAESRVHGDVSTKEAATVEPARMRVEQAAEQTGVYFEENRGQQNGRVRYMTRGGGHTVFLTATEAVYVLMHPTTGEQRPSEARDADPGERTMPTEPRMATALYMTLAGARTDANFVPADQLEHRTNYFKGSDPNNWQSEIPNYRQITANNIYDGVDIAWRGKPDGAMQYDFIVAPNADPSQIEWRIDGANNVSIDADGNLIIETDGGQLIQQKPFTYQDTAEDRTEIASGFVIGNRKSQIANRNSYTVGFEVGEYDRTRPLVIDPSVNLSNLAFSTFLGGGSHEEGYAIITDSSGNVYVTGTSDSVFFPTTAGTFDTTHNGGLDVFVTKLNATGSALLYSTFLGGSSTDEGYSIVVGASGSVFVTGRTDDGATDFPITAGAFDTTHNGLDDVFVTKLNASGSSLLYSTFLGGSSNDRGKGIVVDPSGNVFVTGSTLDSTTDFPITAGAFDTTNNGSADVFVTKLDAAGSALLYSTFIGGSSADEGLDIAADASGRVFVTGQTSDGTTDFPITAGAFDTTNNGFNDVFVTKLNEFGSALLYSTFLGGSSQDFGNGIAVDPLGNAFVTGSTTDHTTDFPITTGAFSTTHNGGSIDAFVTNLNASGTALLYSTFLGGSGNDDGRGIVVDPSGNVYVAGYTQDSTTDFPITVGAFDTTHNLNDDVFVTNLNASGSALLYSTFLGGSQEDIGNGIAVDTSGNVFVTGRTFDWTTDLPTTAEAFQTLHNGDDDAIVTKFGDYSISGRAVDTSGTVIPNTAIGLSGDAGGFMMSDALGNFLFSDTLTTGTFLVSASKPSYTFNPANYNIVTMNRNKLVTFVGTATGAFTGRADLGGRVTSTAGNIGLPNTTLALVDPVDAANNLTITTDQSGNFRFSDVNKHRYYQVFASRDGYNFEPGDLGLAFLNENLNLTFTARPTNPRPVNDFDGDGKTDLVVYRPSEGNWYIRSSQTGIMRSERFGVAGDIPVAEDFDGDRIADVAVFRPSDGNWYWLDSSDGSFHAVHFGMTGDRPVASDYDGDSKADLAVYRPSNGVWYRVDSSTGEFNAVHWGIAADVPVPADYDGDGRADITVFRAGVWYRLGSTSGVSVDQYGTDGDIPMAADLDGDGWPDLAVFRPSSGTWYWWGNQTGETHAMQFGLSGDVPVVADYDGDGRLEPAVYRGGMWYVARPDGSAIASQFGLPGDLPIPATN